MKFNKLTDEESFVIEKKGTESPFSGEYDSYSVDGIYLCRRCNAPLYDSKDKFDSHCGWPSFDDELPGAIIRKVDVDGLRTEITCAHCGAHLGHVFTDEGMTRKNVRHCVNSLSMRFIPRKNTGPVHSAYFGGGCFWCLEAAYENIKGVSMVISGYAGGSKSGPSYEEVCSGTTGHAEMVKIDFDPSIVSYQRLLEIFFSMHDPTTINRQGNDIGTQYRSIILYEDLEQKEQAEKTIEKINSDGLTAGEVVTEVGPLIRFFPAEEYHQKYYQKHPEQAYCQAVISPKLSKLKQMFAKESK